jgi:outer membrane protein assembly factor BamB
LGETPGELFLKAGSRFYFGRRGEVAAVEARPREGTAEVVWRAAIDGDPWTMLAARNRLIVVTRQGTLFCFGPDSGGRLPTTYRETPSRNEPAPWPAALGPSASHLAAKRFRAIGVTEGYAVLFAGGDCAWIDAIARTTLLTQIAVVPSRAADEIRRRADEQGLYGRRLSVHAGDLGTFALPPYMASLVVVEDLPPGSELERLRRVFEILRPYGGVACLPLDADHLARWVSQAGLEGARVKPLDKACALLVREGPLPKAGTWTHQYADAANSVVSQDERVVAPLGLLWFGGPSHDEVLPRHGHGPAPQVAGGRLVIEGRNMLRALDVYTGRMLWQTAFPDLGAFYDNTSHQPGANEIGGNYVTLADAVYVVHGKRIVKLDAATGRTVAEFRLPGPADAPPAHLGFLAVDQDFLVVTSSPLPLFVPPPLKLKATNPFGAALRALRASGEYGPTSRRLAVLDRHTGKVLWQREARYGFRHNNIALGKGRVFCIDGLTPAQREASRRQGASFENYAPRLLALDLVTGREAWSTGDDVFGTFLSYSAQHDILLQAGSAATDRAPDEATKGMAAYRGADGHVLWKDLQRVVVGPPMLLGEKILTQRYAYSLRTGQPQTRPHPLTGQPVPWQFTRNYGCNTAVGCRNLLTFRSAAAGYYDLARDGGTGNWGGFKSGCTSNLIPADGVLSAPDYTRTCTCPYHNQTSLALVHDPSVEMWTFNALAWDGSPVRRVGINFGAPGDRKTDDGALWLDWPSTGGPSPDLPVETEPKSPSTFRQHSAMFRVRPGTPGLTWVAASGLRGVRRVCLRLAKDPNVAPRRYTVRLHFAELDDLPPGTRVFRVRLQGHEAISKLDIVREVGGPRTALVKEVRSIEVRDTLTIDLEPASDASVKETLLCGIEVERELDDRLTRVLGP